MRWFGPSMVMMPAVGNDVLGVGVTKVGTDDHERLGVIRRECAQTRRRAGPRGTARRVAASLRLIAMPGFGLGHHDGGERSRSPRSPKLRSILKTSRCEGISSEVSRYENAPLVRVVGLDPAVGRQVPVNDLQVAAPRGSCDDMVVVVPVPTGLVLGGHLVIQGRDVVPRASKSVKVWTGANSTVSFGEEGARSDAIETGCTPPGRARCTKVDPPW